MLLILLLYLISESFFSYQEGVPSITPEIEVSLKEYFELKLQLISMKRQ